MDRIAQYARLVSGKPIQVFSDASLYVRATVRLAREDAPTHVVRYNPRFQMELPYLLAHECAHLIRIYEAPEVHRRLASIGPVHRGEVARELQGHTRRLAEAGMPMKLVYGLLRRWHDGLVSQVSNYPADMKIERWLWEKHARLREYQELSLRRQLSEQCQAMRSKAALTPTRVYRASMTMNAAFACYMSYLFENASFLEPYKGTMYCRLGRDLAEGVWSIEDGGYPEDTAQTNRWASILGMAHWFDWKPLAKSQ